MVEAHESSWAPFALIVGALGICCAGVPLLAAAILTGGSAVTLLTGVLWTGVGGAAVAAALGTLYLVRRQT